MAKGRGLSSGRISPSSRMLTSSNFSCSRADRSSCTLGPSVETSSQLHSSSDNDTQCPYFSNGDQQTVHPRRSYAVTAKVGSGSASPPWGATGIRRPRRPSVKAAATQRAAQSFHTRTPFTCPGTGILRNPGGVLALNLPLLSLSRRHAGTVEPPGPTPTLPGRPCSTCPAEGQGAEVGMCPRLRADLCTSSRRAAA